MDRYDRTQPPGYQSRAEARLNGYIGKSRTVCEHCKKPQDVPRYQ
jgi:hypothetical protein